MKIIFTSIFEVLFISIVCIAQDSLYIYNGGPVVIKQALADIDSINFYKSANPVKDIVFNPNKSYGTITDIENNSYKTIQIGTQTWMVENLKTRQLNDGTAIPLVTDQEKWEAIDAPRYCWYNNDSATYNASYGVLYNWTVVHTGKLCPTGWHVPTNAQWNILTKYLGEDNIAGGKLKEAGMAHWMSPNTDATNETGFTALPGGFRYRLGKFLYFGYNGYWWSSTEDNTNTYYGFKRSMTYNYGYVLRIHFNKAYGFSVRCLKD